MKCRKLSPKRRKEVVISIALRRNYAASDIRYACLWHACTPEACVPSCENGLIPKYITLRRRLFVSNHETEISNFTGDSVCADPSFHTGRVRRLSSTYKH